jgi:hypothetical protein
MLPGEAAKQDRGVVPLQFREGPLNRLVEMVNLALLDSRFLLQPFSFFLQALADCRLRGQNLNQLAIPLRALNRCSSAHCALLYRYLFEIAFKPK